MKISLLFSQKLKKLNKYLFLLQPDDPIEIRWAHLALLVEFALELKKALQSINEQSFNHFVLKMGEFVGLKKKL